MQALIVEIILSTNKLLSKHFSRKMCYL